MENDAPTRGRIRARRVVVGALGLLPRRAYEPLRRAYFASAPDSTKQRILAKAMKVARLRAITGVDEFAIPDQPDLHLANVDSQIIQRVYWMGQAGYEPGEAAWWRNACRQSQRILEIGANIGYYTVQGAAAARDTTYLAVEPLPANLAPLRRNVELNSLNNVQVVDAAVIGPGGPEHVELMLPDHHPYAASTGAYVSGAAVGDRPASRSVRVPTVSIRDLIEGVDLLKIDIEGYEFDVLDPIRDVLAQTTPVLFVEVLDHGNDLRELLADLVRTGAYSAWALNGEHGIALQVEDLASSIKQRFGTRDIVLAPAARAGELKLGA